jgi:hypothetical protein
VNPLTSLRASLYTRDEERTIRLQRQVHDWAKSGVVSDDQHNRMMTDLPVDLRRTNIFLRLTLGVFGFVIINSFGGLVAIFMAAFGEGLLRWLALAAAAGCLAVAQLLVTRYRLYRFGVEEAAAMAAAVFFTIFVAEMRGSFSVMFVFAVATASAAALFVRFGFIYAGVAATILAPMVIFSYPQSDTVHRLLAGALLLTIFFVARQRRDDHDPEFPADAYGVIAAVAWATMYVIVNLKLSPWLSQPDDVTVFYWGTYATIWMLPIAGLWIAVRDRHRPMLDVNIALAIVTLLSNKPYLGAEPKPWDPILLGVMLTGVAVGLRRWLAKGPDGVRSGYTPDRILASERARMALAGSASVLAPGAPEPSGQDPPEAFGGGSSGGAGASVKF